MRKTIKLKDKKKNIKNWREKQTDRQSYKATERTDKKDLETGREK